MWLRSSAELQLEGHFDTTGPMDGGATHQNYIGKKAMDGLSLLLRFISVGLVEVKRSRRTFSQFGRQLSHRGSGAVVLQFIMQDRFYLFPSSRRVVSAPLS